MYSLKKYSADDTIHVIAVSVSEKKGSKKKNIESCRLLKDFGSVRDNCLRFSFIDTIVNYALFIKLVP